MPNAATADDGGIAKSFKMMDPTKLKTLLERGLGPKVHSVMYVSTHITYTIYAIANSLFIALE